LFIDPRLKAPKLKILCRLLQKKLGFRMLMDVIPLDASLVRGSHGIRPADAKHHPVFITNRGDFAHERGDCGHGCLSLDQADGPRWEKRKRVDFGIQQLRRQAHVEVRGSDEP
jgi:hypothetical protein